MKKMFSLAAAIVAMSSAITLTSCDKFFGNHVDGDSLTDDSLTEQEATDSTVMDDSTEAATLDSEATEGDATAEGSESKKNKK